MVGSSAKGAQGPSSAWQVLPDGHWVIGFAELKGGRGGERKRREENEENEEVEVVVVLEVEEMVKEWKCHGGKSGM